MIRNVQLGGYIKGLRCAQAKRDLAKRAGTLGTGLGWHFYHPDFSTKNDGNSASKHIDLSVSLVVCVVLDDRRGRPLMMKARRFCAG
jgi:hypothetical protein